MSDFNEWFDSSDANDYDDIICAMGDAFKAGAQSKQAEIDELNKKLKSNERVFKKLQDQMVAHACESDELNKRIDEALKKLDLAYPDSWSYCVDEAINILKGTTNEQ